MDTSTEREVRSIIDNGFFSTVYQPIADLASLDAIGYESLMRGPENTCMASPGVLFNDSGALSDELLFLLDHSGFQSSVRSSRHLPDGAKIFINVTCATFNFIAGCIDSYLELFDALEIDVRRIVLEISDNTGCCRSNDMLSNIRKVRAAGMGFALDDVGIRSPYIYQMLMLNPSYIKIDRLFIEGIHKDSRKQDLLSSMNHMALKMDTRLIAEGVETHEELDALTGIGVRYAQGYYLGYPAPAKTWKGHGKLAYKLNCWEFMNCGRQEGGHRAQQGVCPAFAAHGRTCSTVSGTMCTGHLHGSHAEQLVDCLRCDFYNSDHYDRSSAVGRTLKESYDTRMMGGGGLAFGPLEGTDGNRQGNA